MKTIATTALALFVVIAFATNARGEDESTKLFNGKNLNGFYTFVKDKGKGSDPDKVFSVTPEGWLRISGESQGYLATNKSYSNYRLVAEFKWGKGDKSSDSGIFFHADGNDRLWMKSLEVQMRAGATGDLCLIGKGLSLTAAGTKHTGGCVDRAGKGDPKREIENPRGQWNTIELVCQDDRVRVTINGKRLIDGSGGSESSGRIYLQCYSGELFYRKVELHQLQARRTSK